PDPWYPRDYAKSSGIPLAALTPYLEQLWQEGLVQKASKPGDAVPGLALSPAGARALHDPHALALLREGLPVTGGDRAASVRRTLGRRPRPVVSRALLVANLLVFAYGIYLAVPRQAAGPFLSGATGNPAVAALLHASGDVSAEAVVRGQGWRLLTAGFAHIGL